MSTSRIFCDSSSSSLIVKWLWSPLISYNNSLGHLLSFRIVKFDFSWLSRFIQSFRRCSFRIDCSILILFYFDNSLLNGKLLLSLRIHWLLALLIHMKHYLMKSCRLFMNIWLRCAFLMFQMDVLRCINSICEPLQTYNKIIKCSLLS